MLLARDLVGAAVTNRSWWMVPVVLVLVLLSIGATAANAALPYAVYTLF